MTEWDLSAHSPGVGCERCHGGDPTRWESALAHRGILHSSNPSSPIFRANLPQTCGVCHSGLFVAFQKSRHFALLQRGNREVPTCITCHDEVGAHVLSPKSLESQCVRCHGAGKTAPHLEFPARGRLMLQGIAEARALLKEARSMVKRVKDPARRAKLEQMAQQADVPLIEATNAGHAFVFDDLEERLATAKKRIAALFEALVGN